MDFVERLVENRTFDNSMIVEYQRCQRKFYWHYLRGYTTIEKSAALVFGSSIHEALASYYRGDDHTKATMAYMDEMIKSGHVLPDGEDAETVAKTGVIKGGDEEHRTISFGIELLNDYFEKYPIKSEPFKVKQVEIGFALDLPSIDANYGGKIDLRVDSPFGHDIIDHKTARSMGQSFFDEFNPNGQLPGYIWGVREMYGECDGAWVNAIQTAKTKRNMERQRFSYSDFSINEWLMDVEHLAESILMKAEGWYKGGDPDELLSIAFIKTRSACMTYGHCDYRPLCLIDRPPEEVTPPDNIFKQEVWEPWVIEKEKSTSDS